MRPHSPYRLARLVVTVALAMFLSSACSDDSSGGDSAGDVGTDTAVTDTGAGDTGAGDTGAGDTGGDTGAVDSGGPTDSGATDADGDTGVDTGSQDTGSADAGDAADTSAGPCDYRGTPEGVCSDGQLDQAGTCQPPAAYESDEASCDGLDNDCDGVADEWCPCDYQNTAAGVCADGVRHQSGQCDQPAGYESTEASCDGLDNDCDGATDPGCACDYAGSTAGVCAGSTRDDAGQCQAPLSYEADETTCDGLDNDCDGEADEGCSCTEGDTQRCGTDIGQCAFGSQTCSGGTWSTCSGGIQPTTESCDGADNDCDGAADEGCACDYASSPDGVCGGARINQSGVCGEPAAYESDESSCDGLDNDCDGVTDEGCPCDYQAKTQGVCTRGTVASTGICLAPQGYEGREFSCDSLDNDCDGVVDEGCACDYDGKNAGVCPRGRRDTSGVCQPPTDYEADEMTCDSLDNDCDGALDEGCGCNYNGSTIGVCAGGDLDSSGNCTAPAGYESDESACDGLDNDCDGQVDEFCPCDYQGSSQGVCATATRDADGNCQTPSTWEAPESSCDGLDNNCDGVTDEWCACDYGGDSDGVCASGLKDETGYCMAPPSYEADETTCDGADNDCDSAVDEGGCACNYGGDPDGVCAAGTTDAAGNCVAPTSYESDESTCDGQDNDCDGTADEGCSGCGTTCNSGDGCCPAGCDVTTDNDCTLDCQDPATWPQAWVDYEDEVLRLTNLERQSGATCDGTSYPATTALTMDARLREAARCHTLDMAVNDFMGHTGSNGSTLSDRVNATGYTWSSIAENVAVGQPTPADVVAGWMASAGHCRNIMDDRAVHLGVGYVYDSGDALGYDHYWTQVFGTPR